MDQIKRRIRLFFILLLLLAGLLCLFVALGADIVGLDLTPGFGAWQMFFFMIGLTCLSLAGFLFLQGLRPTGAPRSLQADIGVRLAATGLVFAYVSGFADLLGIGTHPHANFPRPFVGPLQLSGIALGIASIVLGMILYYSSRGSRRSSSLEFLLHHEDGDEQPAAPAVVTEEQ
jgi:hypothetical protein